MKTISRHEAAQFLQEHDHFSIISHRRPDGDTAGCSALLCMALRKMGKTAHILKNIELTPKFAPLHEGLVKDTPDAGDTLVSTDVAAPNMLPDSMKELHIDLRIDHHGTATSFTDLEMVDPSAAACGEILWDILNILGVELDVPMANALYTAISTDTGCFRYANTTAHTFETAAACARAGAEVFKINQALFETNTLGRLRLQGWIVENTTFLQNGQIAICPLPLSVEKELNLTEDDTDNISSFPRTIEGVKIAAMLRQENEHKVKLSVRAVPGCDAAAICQQFGGGGHKGAAGAGMEMTMEEAVKALTAAMPHLS